MHIYRIPFEAISLQIIDGNNAWQIVNIWLYKFRFNNAMNKSTIIYV